MNGTECRISWFLTPTLSDLFAHDRRGKCSKKESQTHRPEGTIKVTSLNCCKTDYEAFLPSNFCTELVSSLSEVKVTKDRLVASMAGKGNGWVVFSFSHYMLKMLE